MLEVGAILVSLAMLCDLRHGWQGQGLSNHALHVLVLMLAGSLALTLGTWHHRQHFMGITFLFVVAPGAVALYVLARKLFGEWEQLKQRSRR